MKTQEVREFIKKSKEIRLKIRAGYVLFNDQDRFNNLYETKEIKKAV